MASTTEYLTLESSRLYSADPLGRVGWSKYGGRRASWPTGLHEALPVAHGMALVYRKQTESEGENGPGDSKKSAQGGLESVQEM